MKTPESIAVKVPAQGFMNEKVGIVLLNHVGSSSHQDSGRDAQILADRFGTMTIAANRPSSNRLPRSPELAETLRDTPVKAMLALAAKVDREFTNFGLEKIIITGRSAGGTGALELAQTEGISGAAFVYAVEPVGCRDLTVADGIKRFSDYGKEQSGLLKADLTTGEPRLKHPINDAKDLPRHQRLSRIGAMGPLFWTDKYYNKEHWNQDLVPGYLSHIALDMGLQTHVDFAEYSLVLPPDTEARTDYITKLYGIAGEADGTLSLDVVPNTTHSSFDNRDFMAQRLQSLAQSQAGITLPRAH